MNEYVNVVENLQLSLYMETITKFIVAAAIVFNTLHNEFIWFHGSCHVIVTSVLVL